MGSGRARPPTRTASPNRCGRASLALRFFAVIGAAAAFGLCCSGVRSPGREDARSGARAVAGDTGTAERIAAPGEPERRGSGEARTVDEVVLDLIERAHYAEILTAGGTLCDLGSPGQHACTFGGFRTGWGAMSDDEGATSALARQRPVGVRLTIDEPRDSTVAVRLRTPRPATLEVGVRGAAAGTAEIPADEWHVAAVAVPARMLARGSNELQLRIRGASSARVDWVALLHASTPARPEPRWPRLETTGAASPSIVVPPRTGLSYTFAVPPGSSVALTVVAGAAGSTIVTELATDEPPRAGAAAQPSTTIAPGRPTDLDLPLAGLEGRIARLAITAGDGEVRLTRAQVRQRVERPAQARGSTPAPTNFVIVLIDTLRVDHLTTYAPSTRVRSEAFDQLARRGVVFEQAQVQENWTKPSVATLLTSLYPSSHNAKSAEAILPDAVDMVSEVLARRGFVTAAFIANGYVSGRFGFEQGWDDYTNYVREGIRNRADRVVDDTIAWLDSRPQGEPFFLYVHTIDPHVPYSPPRRYWELYDPAPYSGPIVASRTAQLLADIKVGRLAATERDRVHLEALYDGEITYHDDHLARLVAALDERGLTEDTLIWLTSDHGEEFFDHGSVGHGHSLYQELLHVPLIALIPGREPAGQRIAADVGLVDVVPTSFELLGLEPFAEAQGLSRAPLLRGEPQGLYDAVYSEFLDGGRSVRSRGYSLVAQGRTIQLFDLSADPREQRNVAAERPIALRHMIALLSVHLGDADNPGRARAGTARRRVHERQETPIDDETLQQLRALGYMQD